VIADSLFDIKVWSITIVNRAVSVVLSKTLDRKHKGLILDLTVLANGYLVSAPASNSDSYKLIVWDITKGTSSQVVKTLPGHLGPVNSLIVLPSGTLISAGSDMQIIVW
jgi:WD40 repeat protein